MATWLILIFEVTFKDEWMQTEWHPFPVATVNWRFLWLFRSLYCYLAQERDRQREGKTTFTSNKKVVWIHLLVSERDWQGVRNESSVSSAHLALADYSTWVRSILCPFPTNQRLSQICHCDCSELQVQVWWHHGCKFSPGALSTHALLNERMHEAEMLLLSWRRSVPVLRQSSPVLTQTIIYQDLADSEMQKQHKTIK